MISLKFRHWALLAAFIIAAAVSINSLWRGDSSPDKTAAQVDAVSKAGNATELDASEPKLDGIWLPEDLKRQSDVFDYSFGRILTYSDGRDGPFSRTVWLQTWNAKTDSVEAYGSEKTWWLGDPKTDVVSIGNDKIQLESLTDQGAAGGKGPIRWFRMAWIAGDSGFRLLSRNISEEEFLKIANSLPHR